VDFPYVWGEALDVWNRIRPDVKLVNLETAITQSEEAWPGKEIHYRMSPENVPCLTTAGIDCCALANNHILDWGYSGLEETLSMLERADVKSAGAGRTLDQAAAPAILAVEGRGRVVVFSLGSTTSGIPLSWAASCNRGGVYLLEEEGIEQLRERVEAVKLSEDVVVASIHWGPNWGYKVPRAHVIFAHRLVDEAGIDIVQGHSSHHALGIEVHNGRLVLYGCGDFLTDYEGIPGNEGFRGDLGLMYFAHVDSSTRRLLTLRMIPTQMRRFRLSRPPPADVRWLKDTLDHEGKRFGTRVEWGGDESFYLRW
jgi:poly-gamma-glutamate synthesis protein (capsule biosynthesis protein)